VTISVQSYFEFDSRVGGNHGIDFHDPWMTQIIKQAAPGAAMTPLNPGILIRFPCAAIEPDGPGTGSVQARLIRKFAASTSLLVGGG
jgi:hypothetical protein